MLLLSCVAAAVVLALIFLYIRDLDRLPEVLRQKLDLVNTPVCQKMDLANETWRKDWVRLAEILIEFRNSTPAKLQ